MAGTAHWVRSGLLAQRGVASVDYVLATRRLGSRSFAANFVVTMRGGPILRDDVRSSLRRSNLSMAC